MEDRLKQLMQELGNAINESLSDSDRIAAAIKEIKSAGYDVFLVLEATIGFNKRNAGETDDGETEIDDATLEARLETAFEREFTGASRRGGPAARLRWTAQDQKFLRALKISVEDEAR